MGIGILSWTLLLRFGEKGVFGERCVDKKYVSGNSLSRGFVKSIEFNYFDLVEEGLKNQVSDDSDLSQLTRTIHPTEVSNKTKKASIEDQQR